MVSPLVFVGFLAVTFVGVGFGIDQSMPYDSDVASRKK
jgi:hypothetical protein